LEQGGAEGDNYVGAYGIVNRVGMLMVQMVIGFSQGLQPIVGFNLGAKLYARVRGVLFVAFTCAICVMTVGYTLVCIFPRQLTMLFTTDPRLIEICEPALRIVFCIFPLVGGQMITVSFFQAIRKAWKAIFLSMTRQMIFLLPLLLILPPMMGPTGVWWSMPIADAISSVMSVFLLLPELKKFKRLAAGAKA
jgi:Na+-driven multidrug efflux pump